MTVLQLVVTLALAAPPAGQGDVVLSAMQDELARSSGLRLDGLPSPYHVLYAVTDRTTVQLQAAYGGLRHARTFASRRLRVDVRVGSAAFDSSEVLAGGSWALGQGDAILPVDDDYTALRRHVWLATDHAYKEALEVFSLKEAHRKNARSAEAAPDWSPIEATRLVLPQRAPPEVGERWESDLAALSKRLAAFRHVEDSRVALHSTGWTRRLVSTDPIAVRESHSLSAVHAYARALAPDGAQVSIHRSFYARQPSALPSPPRIARELDLLGRDLRAVQKAPVAEDYVGPVLFEGQAAAQLVSQALVPRFNGHRPPLAIDYEFMADRFRRGFERRLNRRVLPRTLSVYDDPTLAELDGKPMLGGYRVDDEGVPARRVLLVDRGQLRAYLMTRRPLPKLAGSNGHARSVENGTPTAVASNLVVQTHAPLPVAVLRARLLDLCRAQGMTYGLIVRRLREPGITRDADPAVAARPIGKALTSPIEVVRIRVSDGREERVRGLAFEELPPRIFKEVLAAGDDLAIHHQVLSLSGGSGAAHGVPWSQPGVEGIPVSVASPSLLLEEVELGRSPGKLHKPRLLGREGRGR